MRINLPIPPALLVPARLFLLNLHGLIAIAFIILAVPDLTVRMKSVRLGVR